MNISVTIVSCSSHPYVNCLGRRPVEIKTIFWDWLKIALKYSLPVSFMISSLIRSFKNPKQPE